MKTLYIGDVHGENTRLKELLRYTRKITDYDKAIQVGDLDTDERNHFDFNQDLGEFYYIEGNHDNYTRLNSQRLIPRGSIIDGVLYIGGAWSIDRIYRVAGYNWFPDEQLSYQQFDNIINDPKLSTVHTMICHDTISSCYKYLGIELFDSPENIHHISLQNIFEICKPSLYIHGHHHIRKSYSYNNCEFHCLSTLSYYGKHRVKAMYDNCTILI